jgi:quercetin dioxygenase-like cupin family protein
MGGAHVGPDEGERIPRGPRYHRVLVELPEVEAVDARFGPGFEVALHRHEDHVDSFYVLEGEAEFTIGDEIVRAPAGTWLSVPVGTIHVSGEARPARRGLAVVEGVFGTQRPICKRFASSRRARSGRGLSHLCSLREPATPI